MIGENRTDTASASGFWSDVGVAVTGAHLAMAN